jgi:molybdopterin converting factor small subunit
MRVTVHYLAQIKRAAGVRVEKIEVGDGATLAAALTALAARHDEPFRAMLLDDAGRPRRTLVYFVNDSHSEPDRVLLEGDEISILAPMAGG